MQITPKKSLGQHFLKSEKALRDIINTANLKNGEKVLEIGPGTGILTKDLLRTGANIVAIEKDSRACDLLNEKFQSEIHSGQIKIINEDVLETNISKIDLQDNEYALIANIPYYITGAILEKFLEYRPRPNRMVLLVQKEVAERIVAKDQKESVLSISVKAFGKPKIVSSVPRGAFFPPPNVDSAILYIENISDINFKQISDQNNENYIKTFFQIVKAGFAHKRKFLIRNLEAIIKEDVLQKIWLENKLEPKIRPENMKVEDWMKILKQYHILEP